MKTISELVTSDQSIHQESEAITNLESEAITDLVIVVDQNNHTQITRNSSNINNNISEVDDSGDSSKSNHYEELNKRTEDDIPPSV